MLRSILCLSVLLTAVSFAALADEPKVISTHGDWTAYSFKEGQGTVCYMASTPKKAEGKYSKRGDVFALVTHRPAENTKNVFSYITGYDYKQGSDVTLTIDGTNYTLFTHKDMAWAKDADTDNKIAAALRKGSKMTVKGVSTRGTETTDTFSLKGTGGASDAINKVCNIKG
ncbi:MAG TPA: invasion associated locus B family protein [Alphaproteobacteria bacterium]